MSEPNIVREVAAGLDNAPELSEADYEAMEAADRKRTIERLEAEEQRLWAELKSVGGECELCEARRAVINMDWTDAYTELREAKERFGL